MIVDTSELSRLVHDLRIEASGPEFRGRAERAVGQVVAFVHAQATADVPVRSGALKASLRAQHNGLSGSVGSNLKQGFFTEYGTSKMAPQPWLMTHHIAAYRMLRGMLEEGLWKG
jgi:hypothetical protein